MTNKQSINNILNEIELESPSDAKELRALKLKVELEERLNEVYRDRKELEKEEIDDKYNAIIKSMKPGISEIRKKENDSYCGVVSVNASILSFINSYVETITKETDVKLISAYLTGISEVASIAHSHKKHYDAIQASLKKIGK